MESFAHEIEASDLTGKLIVSTPSLYDPHFYHTVTYICAHNENGAIGLIVNRPTSMDLADIFEQMDIHAEHMPMARNKIYAGGPVQQERGFVLHAPCNSWNSSIQISDQLCVTTSRDIIHALANGDGPNEVLITLGYAGWTTGQLEHELAEDSWLCVPFNPNLLFYTPPEKRWAASIEMLGFNAGSLSIQSGQA